MDMVCKLNINLEVVCDLMIFHQSSDQIVLVDFMDGQKATYNLSECKYKSYFKLFNR